MLVLTFRNISQISTLCAGGDTRLVLSIGPGGEVSTPVKLIPFLGCLGDWVGLGVLLEGLQISNKLTSIL